MKNNKILRYGGIAALILIALYAFTFFSNDARGYVQADTSVALTQLKDKTSMRWKSMTASSACASSSKTKSR